MEEMVCPMCGSRYFLSTRSSEKVVFQVQHEGDAYFIEIAEETGSETGIDRQEIFCSSCSWHGSITETLKSR